MRLGKLPSPRRDFVCNVIISKAPILNSHAALKW
jgi:hypothetical protein